MSLFSSLAKNLVHWGIQTAKTEGQQVGLKALNDAMSQLQSVAATHAPDVAPLLAPLADQMVATIVAGLKTRQG